MGARILRTVFVLSLCLGLGYLGYWGIYYYQRLFVPIAITQSEIFFEVPAGSSLSAIANKFQEEDIPIEPKLFLALVRWQQVESKLKAGEYRIVRDITTPIALLEDMVMGRVVQHPFQLLEGWTIYQILAALAEEPNVAHTSGLTAETVLSQIRIAGMPASEHPEGLFFPDTYYFTKHTQDIVLLKRIMQVMEKKLQGAWNNRRIGSVLKTPYEALILASIVEKETAKSDEYAKIAGVYVNRLNKKMLLQADPTVSYGIGQHFMGPLTKQHLQTPSAYNTYLNAGLPPTPICIPSERAIQAVMHPEITDALYFVASGQEGGGHYFSKTLAEHNEAVARYRKAIAR